MRNVSLIFAFLSASLLFQSGYAATVTNTADSGPGTLRQAIACAEPTTETVTAAAPDIDDGGDLTQGNLQLHPADGHCP